MILSLLLPLLLPLLAGVVELVAAGEIEGAAVIEELDGMAVGAVVAIRVGMADGISDGESHPGPGVKLYKNEFMNQKYPSMPVPLQESIISLPGSKLVQLAKMQHSQIGSNSQD